VWKNYECFRQDYQSCFFIVDKVKKWERRQIQIPMDKGRNMLGVLDETGQLEYGQVHVQYTCEKTREPITLTGSVPGFGI